MEDEIELVDFDYYLEDVVWELGNLDSDIFEELEFIDEEGDLDEAKMDDFFKQAKQKPRSSEIQAMVDLIGDRLSEIDFEDSYVTETSMGYAFSVSTFAGLWQLNYEGDSYSYFKSEDDALRFLESW